MPRGYASSARCGLITRSACVVPREACTRSGKNVKLEANPCIPSHRKEGCMDDAGILALVNQIRQQLAGFARTIVMDFADNKLSTTEGIQLIIQDADADTRQKILRVLEHGELRMPA